MKLRLLDIAWGLVMGIILMREIGHGMLMIALSVWCLSALAWVVAGATE